MYPCFTRITVIARFISSIWVRTVCIAFLWLWGCQVPASHTNTTSTSQTEWTNKTWRVKEYRLKEQLGILYRNREHLESSLDQTLQNGLVYHFFDDGIFSMAEGPAIVFGAWSMDRETVKCTCRRVSGSEQMIWSEWVVSGNQLQAVLNTEQLTLEITAIADEQVLPKNENPWYPKQ